MPVDRPDNSGVRPTRSPDGSLLGWLRVNYPDTYNAIVQAPRDQGQFQYRDGVFTRKRPSQSGLKIRRVS